MTHAVWHYHHSRFLLEFPIETIESRLEFIDAEKHPCERNLRKKLLKAVVGTLPIALEPAGVAYSQAEEKWYLIDTAWNQAAETWEHVYYENLPAIQALHAVECPDCPWKDRTIFNRKDENGNWY